MAIRTMFKGYLLLALISILYLPSSAQRTTVSTDSDSTLSRSVSTSPFAFRNLVPFQQPGRIAAAPALNGVVRAIAQSNGNTYVGGDFTYIGDDPINFIARWDGTAWNPLGGLTPGVDGPVRTILVDGDKVYVGGNFTRAGSTRTRNIAVWNRVTNTWSGLGGGVGGTLRNGVSAIAVHDGQLYVAGSFIAAGKIVAANIARWDGQRWHRVGTGINNVVHTLHIEGNYLYAGGDFTIAGDVRSPGFARYDLTTGRWENPGIEIDGSVKAIAADDRYIYVGGIFDSIQGRFANNIIRVDKANGQWSPMHKGLQGYNYVAGGVATVKGVETILVHGTDVFVGGTLTQTLTQRIDGEFLIGLVGLAKWNGAYWSNLATASNVGPPGPRKNQIAPPNIYALTSGGDNTILIGGDFDDVTGGIGPDPVPYFCKLSLNDSLFSSFAAGTAKKGEGSLVVSEFGRPKENAERREYTRQYAGAHYLRPGSGLTTADSPHPVANSFASVPDDIYWHPVESYVSNDNGVLALAADDDEVYAGGTFTHLYGIETNGIAVRKNKEWSPLDDGTALGVDGFVYAIAVNGSKVYVGGQFSRAGGIEARNIAVWDRSTRTWSALDDGINGEGSNPPFVSAIILRGDEVYVGGNFTTAGETSAENIARWSGGEWTPLGEGIDGPVNALEFFRENLYAGGSFTRAGTISSNGIAYWDGEKWNGMDGGLNGFVNDIVTYVTERDTAIAVGGQFTRDMQSIPDSPAVYARNLIWWTGAAWYAKPSLAPLEPEYVQVNGEVRDLQMVGGDLYVAGAFDNAFPRSTGSSGALLENIAFYNEWVFAGTPVPMWHSLDGGLRGNVNALAVSGDEIFAGGDFTRIVNDDLSADHVALWNLAQQDWVWAGNPTALAPIEALAIHDNTLYASGSFISQEIGLFDVTNYLVRLTQPGWRVVDGPIRGTGFALSSVAGDELVMGGAMISSNALIAVNVSRWNSTTGDWKPLTPGSGVASLEDISFVSAVASDQDNVYVGGNFDIADTMTVRNIARWNRSTGSWHRLGEGLNGTVLALAVDADGALYAGGSFDKSGNRDVSHVARWDGTSWQPLGQGVDGHVFSLAVADGILYAGGAFTEAGGENAANVARWDIPSQTWSPLGAGLAADFEPGVYALAVSRGRLFAAGKFDVSGLDSVHNIARWNPAGWWTPLGSGTDRLVNSLAISRDGSVYAGGYFLTAGSKELSYIGLWKDPTLSVEPEPIIEAGGILRPCMPDPFTTGTRAILHLPEGKSRNVRLELYDATGRKHRTLAEGLITSGAHSFPIDGDDLPSGVYMLRLQSDEKIESIKLTKW